jgi:hypothetical protein
MDEIIKWQIELHAEKRRLESGKIEGKKKKIQNEEKMDKMKDITKEKEAEKK